MKDFIEQYDNKKMTQNYFANKAKEVGYMAPMHFGRSCNKTEIDLPRKKTVEKVYTSLHW